MDLHINFKELEDEVMNRYIFSFLKVISTKFLSYNYKLKYIIDYLMERNLFNKFLLEETNSKEHKELIKKIFEYLAFSFSNQENLKKLL